MKHLVGTLCGFLSGLLVYFSVGMLTITPGSNQTPILAIISLFAAWIGTHYLCVKGTDRALKALSRGFLIGAIEWFFVIFVGIIVSGRAVVETSAKMGGDAASSAGAAIGGGMAMMLSGTIGIVMAIICLIGYAITFLLSRELKTENLDNSKKCPDCADLVNKDAKKCKHCGHIFGENKDVA